MRTRLLAGGLALVGAVATLALANIPESRAAGDPANGRQLTLDVCAECHRTPANVGGGDGPSLDRLSRQRSFTPDRLAEVMTTDPHGTDLRLSRAELRDISAYLNLAGVPAATTGSRTARTDASGDDDASAQTGRRAMALEDIIRRLGREGYSDIREVEREDGDYYEVYARAPDGRRVELEVDALTGKILDREDND
jgi:mono/diheme cytochrome c family protein